MPKSPHKYFVPKDRVVRRGPSLPWQDLRAAMAERGWIDLNNVRTTIDLRGQRIALAGVNDPYTRRDHYELIEGPADHDAVVRIGVTHTPSPACSTASPSTGTNLVLPGTRTAVRCGSRASARSPPTATLDRSRARGVSRWGRTPC